MELKEALEICVRMWDYLAINPKETNKKFVVEHFLFPLMDNNCACCEYTIGISGTCDDCPLFGMWGIDKENNDSCLNKKSPYVLWNKAETNKTRSKYAKQIADIARLRLQDFTY